MISVWHLVWIVPLAALFGFSVHGLLSGSYDI